MKRVVALLAAATCTAALAACGGGAEPGAPKRATLVLDFQPNAVHAGIYTALEKGYYEEAGVELDVQQPSSSTDAPKLLEAGTVQFAILDIHDLAIAREHGFIVVGVTPIVQRPLASVIGRSSVRRPRDLEGRTVGVTGLPSDDAVLDSVVAADGGDPAKVHRVTIGFNAVAALAAGRVDAATAFWNAEGVTLKRQGVATRTFRVDSYGAPRYPELVLVTTAAMIHGDPNLVGAVAEHRPAEALDDLEATNPDLDRADQQAELRALDQAAAFQPPGQFDVPALSAWARWEAAHGIVKRPPDIERTFISASRLRALGERAPAD